MTFNEKDTFLTIVTTDGFLYLYDLIKFKRAEGSIDRNCDFRSSVFLTDPSSSLSMNFAS